jgi:hypothetical protein
LSPHNPLTHKPKTTLATHSRLLGVVDMTSLPTQVLFNAVLATRSRSMPSDRGRFAQRVLELADN